MLSFTRYAMQHGGLMLAKHAIYKSRTALVLCCVALCYVVHTVSQDRNADLSLPNQRRGFIYLTVLPSIIRSNSHRSALPIPSRKPNPFSWDDVEYLPCTALYCPADSHASSAGDIVNAVVARVMC